MNPYLVLSNVLSSGYRELSSIDISIQRYALQRAEITMSAPVASVHHCAAGCLKVLEVDSYLCSVGAGQAEFNDEDRL